MGLEICWSNKTWNVGDCHATHNLGLTNEDNLKLVIEIRYNNSGDKNNQLWAECKYVPYQEEIGDIPAVPEHLAGEVGGRKFKILLDTPGKLTCKTPVDGGEGGYTSWTAEEGAG